MSTTPGLMPNAVGESRKAPFPAMPEDTHVSGLRAASKLDRQTDSRSQFSFISGVNTLTLAISVQLLSPNVQLTKSRLFQPCQDTYCKSSIRAQNAKAKAI